MNALPLPRLCTILHVDRLVHFHCVFVQSRYGAIEISVIDDCSRYCHGSDVTEQCGGGAPEFVLLCSLGTSMILRLDREHH